MQYYYLLWPIDWLSKPECENGIGGPFFHRKTLDTNIAEVAVENLYKEGKSFNDEEFEES